MNTIRIPPLSALKTPDGLGLKSSGSASRTPPRPMPVKTPATAQGFAPITMARTAPRPQPKPDPAPMAAIEPTTSGNLDAAAPQPNRTAWWLGGALVVLGLCGGGIAWQLLAERPQTETTITQPATPAPASPARVVATPAPAMPTVASPAVAAAPSANQAESTGPAAEAPAAPLSPEVSIPTWDILLGGR